MAFTKNFIFSDAVPAQQAVQYAHLDAQQQAQADQAFTDRMRNASQANIARQNADQQRMMSQSQMQNSNAQRDLDRQLQDRGYLSQQEAARIAAGRATSGGTFEERLQAQKDADRAALKQKHETGKALALILINPNVPEREKAKVRETALKSGLITVNQRGYYIPAFPDPDLAVPPAPPVKPVENYQDILNRRAGMGPSTISVTPMPGPGFQPRATDFTVPPVSAYPYQIRASDMTVPGSSASTASPNSPIQWNNFPSYPGTPAPDWNTQDSFTAPRQSDLVPVQQDVPVDQPWIYDQQPQY